MKLIITENNSKWECLPNVVLDKEANVFKIYGNSYAHPFLVISRLGIIISWIKEYLQETNEISTFYLCFSDPNTFTIHQFIIKLLYSINNIPSNKIYWLFEKGDFDTEELIEDLRIDTGINIISTQISKLEFEQFKIPYYLPSL